MRPIWAVVISVGAVSAWFTVAHGEGMASFVLTGAWLFALVPVVMALCLLRRRVLGIYTSAGFGVQGVLLVLSGVLPWWAAAWWLLTIPVMALFAWSTEGGGSHRAG